MKIASCMCGQLSAECPDDHVLHVQCSCVDCRKRTGTPTSFQIFHRASTVKITGNYKTRHRKSFNGRNMSTNFCPECGGTIALNVGWAKEVFGEDIYGIPLGCFDDASIGAPDVSVWNCFLPDWFPPLSSKEAQMERQPESIEDLRQATQSLGKL